MNGFWPECKKLMPLPVPKLVVFYNGEEEKEDQMILRLSDSFKEEMRRGVRRRNAALTHEEIEAEVERLYRDANPDIEVKVRMVNINYGHNKELLSACKPLEEYSWFVDRVRSHNEPDENGDRIGIRVAIDHTLDEMPDGFVIKELLIENRAEVMDMCLTEYNETEVMELFKEEGREEGEKNSTVTYLKNVMESLGIGIDRAMETLKIPDDQRMMYRGLVERVPSMS